MNSATVAGASGPVPAVVHNYRSAPPKFACASYSERNRNKERETFVGPLEGTLTLGPVFVARLNHQALWLGSELQFTPLGDPHWYIGYETEIILAA